MPAADAGLDRAAAERLIAGNAGLTAVRREINVAQNAGISGVPSFVIDGRYAVVGAQSPELPADVIDKAMAERQS